MLLVVNLMTPQKMKEFLCNRLPTDPEVRRRWIETIPRDNIPDEPDAITLVCAKLFFHQGLKL